MMGLSRSTVHRLASLLVDRVLHRDDGRDRICCIAAPIRDASGTIVAALSLSSTSFELSLGDLMDDR